MALHSTPASMLKESLEETLEAAKFCILYRKDDPKWGEFRGNGCLGYPGGILLFSIIDTIGSCFRKNKNLKILVDGKEKTIDSSGWVHFMILNSKYFNQNLTTDFLKALYNKFRSSLTHNSLLSRQAYMRPSNKGITELEGFDCAFATRDANGNIEYWVFLEELYALCEKAINEFKKDIDEVVPNSKQGNKFH